MPCRRSPKPTLASAVSHGKRAASAFWKNTTRSRPARVIGAPSSVRSAAEAGSKPATMLRRVVLPQPLAPRRQKSSLLPISRSIPARTLTASPPRRSVKRFSRRRITSTTRHSGRSLDGPRVPRLPAKLRRHALGQGVEQRPRIEERLRIELPLREPRLLHPAGELREVVPDDPVEADHALVVGVVRLHRRGVLDAELLPSEL